MLAVQSAYTLLYSQRTLRFTWDSFSVVLDLDSAGLDTDGDLAFNFYIRVAVAGQMYILDKNTALAAVQVMVIHKPYLYHHRVISAVVRLPEISDSLTTYWEQWYR